nr:hypothetical protein LSAT_9X27681 [Tanacetum cinerariifolium]
MAQVSIVKKASAYAIVALSAVAAVSAQATALAPSPDAGAACLELLEVQKQMVAKTDLDFSGLIISLDGQSCLVFVLFFFQGYGYKTFYLFKKEGTPSDTIMIVEGFQSFGHKVILKVVLPRWHPRWH